MKIILIAAVAVMVAGGTLGVLDLRNSLTDPGEIFRAKADRIMSQAYGTDWCAMLCNENNAAEKLAMVAAYKSAMGLRK